MNYRLVLKAYSNLRQMTDEESALLETLRGLTDAERELLVEALSPQKQSSKKSVSKSAGKGTKSKRASGMAAAIRDSLQRSKSATGGLPNAVSRLCVVQVDDNGGLMECGEAADHNVHHLSTHPDYHEFDAGKSPASTAVRPSSANGGVTSTTANSEIAMDTATNAHHAGG